VIVRDLFMVCLSFSTLSSCSPNRDDNAISHNEQWGKPEVTRHGAVQSANQCLTRFFPGTSIPPPRQICETKESFELLYPFRVDLYRKGGPGSYCVVIVQKQKPESRIVQFDEYLESTRGRSNRLGPQLTSETNWMGMDCLGAGPPIKSEAQTQSPLPVEGRTTGAGSRL
jgi:hypothetical protein